MKSSEKCKGIDSNCGKLKIVLGKNLEKFGKIWEKFGEKFGKNFGKIQKKFRNISERKL